MSETYDYIVVGGGASGSVVASRLAAAGAAVLLLEAGGTDKRMDVVVPGLVASVYANCNWRYQIEPDPTRSNAPDVQMAGKVLGGGGSINSCVYVRGNKDLAVVGANNSDRGSRPSTSDACSSQPDPVSPLASAARRVSLATRQQ